LFFSGQEDATATTATLGQHNPDDRHDVLPPRPAAGTSSLQRQRAQLQQQPSSAPHHRETAADVAAAIHYDELDLFVVGPPGGLFQSTTDPDVSIFFPPSAVTQTITLTMQARITAGENYDDDNNNNNNNRLDLYSAVRS